MALRLGRSRSSRCRYPLQVVPLAARSVERFEIPEASHGCPARFLRMLRRRMVLASWQTERPLTRASEGFGWRSVELVEAPGLHDVELNKPGKAQRTADGGLQFLRHAQQQKGDQGDGHLDAD